MFRGKVLDIVLEPGQGVFFSDGVMHEISIPKNEQSVSIAIKAAHIYPILNVVKDLCTMSSIKDAFTINTQYLHWDKFRTYYFNPTRFVTPPLKPYKAMPTLLRKKFLEVIIPKTAEHSKMLPVFLDRWWVDLTVRKNYSPTGLFPEQPVNRADLLKKWEEERLTKNQSDRKSQTRSKKR